MTTCTCGYRLHGKGVHFISRSGTGESLTSDYCVDGRRVHVADNGTHTATPAETVKIQAYFDAERAKFEEWLTRNPDMRQYAAEHHTARQILVGAAQ